jgi:Ca-activated chloride channel family protein
MKKLLPLVLVSAFALAACGLSAQKLNNQGNEAFYNQDFDGALAAYQEAQADSPELAEPHYNAANAHYRQGAYEQAEKELEQTLIKDEGDLSQSSTYNLGNTFFQGEQYEQAIEAYKEVLRLNPDDIEAKQNLELALRQLQQQQQEQEQQDQQQEQQQDQQQDQNEEQNQEQQQNDQQQNNDGQDQEQNDQQQQDGQDGNQQQDDRQQDGQQNGQQQGDRQEDKQQDNGQQDEQQQDGQQGEDQQQPQNGQPDNQQQDQSGGQPPIVKGLTKEQARQLLEAAAEGTQSLEEYLRQILVAPGAPPAEDW